MRTWLRETWIELKARRAGRLAMGNDKSTFDAARGIIGATGNGFSNAWELLDEGGDAYLKSFGTDQHIPPSLFVSERDRVRYGMPAPVAERCIEDHGNPDAVVVRDWDVRDLDGQRLIAESAGPGVPDVDVFDTADPDPV